MASTETTTPSEVHFRSRLLATVAFPLILLVIAGGLLTAQVWWLTNTARRVEQSDRVTTQAFLTLGLVVDMETGLRGYLLTKNDEFLEPYNAARAEIDDAFETLGRMLGPGRRESKRVAAARGTFGRWWSWSQEQIQLRDGGTDYLREVRKKTGKKMVDSIRQDLAEVLDAERGRREERNFFATRATQWVLAANAGITVLVAVLIALFSFRQLTGLSRAYAAALNSTKRQSEAFRESEQRWRAIFEQAPVAVVQTDLEGHIVQFNDRLPEITGYPSAELERMKMSDMTHPEERDAEATQWATLLREPGRGLSAEKRLVRKDGSVAWVGVTGSLIRGAGNRPGTVIQVLSDLSARRYLAGPLRRLGARFRHAADVVGIGTWDFNLATGEAIWSERQEALFGLAPGTFAGTGDAYLAMIHPDDRQAVIDAGRRAVDQRMPYRTEYRIIRPDGAVRWLADSGDVICGGPEKSATHLIGITVDITDRKQATALPPPG